MTPQHNHVIIRVQKEKGVGRMAIKFIKYDGKYPNLCSGILTLEINGKKRKDIKIRTLGNAGFTKDWNEFVQLGEWEIDELPEDLQYLELEIEKIVNENVPLGCCGGCL